MHEKQIWSIQHYVDNSVMIAAVHILPNRVLACDILPLALKLFVEQGCRHRHCHAILPPGAVAAGLNPSDVDHSWADGPPHATAAGSAATGCGGMCHVSPGSPCRHSEEVFFDNFIHA
jgi:hypothetical protein